MLEAVKRLQLAIRVASDAALSGRGLTLTQTSALTALATVGPLPCSSLARRLGITRQSMQELVGTLHTRGLLTKTSDPGDARHIVVDLSGSGKKAAREATKVMREVEMRMERGMSPAERLRLLDGLKACLYNLEGRGADERDSALSAE